jgi:hypothetical protein
MAEKEVLAALRALAESDREKEAPSEVEARLRQAFRQRRGSKRILKRVAVWGLAAAAAVAIVFTNYRRELPREPVRAAEMAPSVETSSPEQQVVPVVAGRVRKPAPVGRVARREIVTEFFPLMDVAPPFERGELVRVNLPASAMRTVGLPVREDRLADRVDADVLVGEEGLARAIRFVKVSQ